MGVQRTAELVATGLSQKAVAKSADRGERVVVRHGAWSDRAPSDEVERHRQLVAGTWPLLGAAAVLSHASAAVLHGLPVWTRMLERVSVTRPSGGHGTRTRNLHVRRAPLAPQEVTELEGYRVTVLERTAIDVARMLSYERAVAVLDAAIRGGAAPGLLGEEVAAAFGRAGCGVAGMALEFADGRAESVGESISRVRLVQLHLPAPELQYEVFDRGLWVARVDFAWPRFRVVGEFDGAVKYTGSPGEVARVVMAEKHRQQAIEDAGWRVVRWTWRDLDDPGRLRARIAAAIAQGGTRVR